MWTYYHNTLFFPFHSSNHRNHLITEGLLNVIYLTPCVIYFNVIQETPFTLKYINCNTLHIFNEQAIPVAHTYEKIL